MTKYIVYLIKNTVTNKIYIGYTKNSLEHRWKQHCNRAKKDVNTPFYNAIKKYGEDIWDKSIIFECESVQEVKQKEIELIAKHDSYNNGYNATTGGDGNHGIKMSQESNHKRSIALKGIPKNYPCWAKGKNLPEEIKQKLRKPKKDKSKYQTEEFKQIMREKQRKHAKARRMLNKEQYDKIQEYMKEGISKKQISKLLNISYDLVKKWSLKTWED